MLNHTGMFGRYRGSFTILVTMAAMLLSACDQDDSPGNASILWDKWGVPHIYANSPEAADYAFGRAQMTNHANLLLELYGTARGRAAEYWGKKHIRNDRYLHKMGVPERAPQLLAAQGPEYIARLEAFVAGMNDWVAENPDAIKHENRQVLPILPTDVVAQVQSTIHTTFFPMNNGSLIRGWKKNLKEQGAVPGSNAWAIGPSRSESGNAMLLINPHLPWRGLFLFFEAHINVLADNGRHYNNYGIGLVGMPFLAAGFNENLGWTHTVNTIDGLDTYELQLADDGNDGYILDGEIHPFTDREITLKLRSDNGTMSSETLQIRHSIHGPVVAEQSGSALVWKMAGLTEPEHSRLFEQYWQMGLASNLEEFETALSMQQMPMFNTIYADRHGDIFYSFNGLVPLRSEGDVAFWEGIVDGTRSNLVWNKYRTYDELPKFRNPESGFIQNSNDPPWTSTFPQVLKAEDFPPDISPQTMNLRAQSSANMLLADDSITFEELLEYRKSTRLILADRLLDDLITAARVDGNTIAIEAAEVLSRWDRQTNPDSRGAVLFMAWSQHLARRKKPSGDLFRVKWSPKDPLHTPRGLANIDVAVAALVEATENVRRDYGTIDVAWGEVARVRYAGKDLPASVGPGDMGSFRVGFLSAPGEGGIIRVRGGNTFVAAIEFGEHIRARGILGPGNATEASTGHFGDQLELQAAGKFRNILFTPEEVEAGAVRREHLQYPQE